MDPRSIDTFGGSFPAVLSLESRGFDAEKCGCFEGPNKVVHFSGKVLDLTIGRLSGCGIEVHPGPVEAVAKTIWATVDLVGFAVGGIEAAWGPVGMVARGAGAASASAGMVIGAVEAALGAAMPSWLGGVKQNSSEAKPLSCEHLVGVRRFELLTSSLTRKRSQVQIL